jgi:hypothetical protein
MFGRKKEYVVDYVADADIDGDDVEIQGRSSVYGRNLSGDRIADAVARNIEEEESGCSVQNVKITKVR